MRVTLATWQALGDTLVSLPTAFHLEAQGYEVSILNTRGKGQVQRRQYAPLLPTYPRLCSRSWGRRLTWDGQADPANGFADGLPVAYGAVMDLTAGKRFNWHSDGHLCEEIAANVGLQLGETPHFPLLKHEPWYPEVAAELTGSGDPYVLVAPEGSAPNRMLSERQIRAIAHSARTVVVHHRPREYNADVVNLSGRTNIMDLCALTACAAAVVSVDTGVWHLAPAFLTPMLGLVGLTSDPRGLDYRPTLYLKSVGADGSIDPLLVVDALQSLFVARPLATAPLPPTGLRWWETAEVRTRLAVAEEHQRNILRAHGGRRVVEV